MNALFSQYRFDYVFHLAAYAAEGLSHFIRAFDYTNNLLGSIHLINAAAIHRVRCFVFTSSAAVYGAARSPLTEDATPAPEDPYGIAKLAVEQDLRAATKVFGLQSVIFRPHNVYGERQNLSDPYRNVIGIFMRQALSGQPCTIFGNGKQTRAFSYIADIAPIIAASVRKPAAYGQVFNIGADDAHSITALAELVQERPREARGHSPFASPLRGAARFLRSQEAPRVLPVRSARGNRDRSSQNGGMGY